MVGAGDVLVRVASVTADVPPVVIGPEADSSVVPLDPWVETV